MRAVTDGAPTRWFEELYAAARRGEIDMPWDRDTPFPLLAPWLADRRGDGRRAVVVGCGLGVDAEHVAACGYATTAFDVSATAVAEARARHPDSRVDYRVADLLALPAAWHGGFALVVEIITVQALPRSARADAIAAVATLVAPGGTLFVAQYVQEDEEPVGDTPPWPLTRAEVASFAQDGLRAVSVERVDRGEMRDAWLAEFTRPG